MNHPKLRITPFLISMVTTSVALLNRIMTQSLPLTGKTGSLTPYSICVRFLFHVFAPTPWKINMERTNHPFKRKMIFQTSMIMFHVNLQGCILSFPQKGTVVLKPSPRSGSKSILRSPGHLKSTVGPRLCPRHAWTGWSRSFSGAYHLIEVSPVQRQY